MTISLLSSPPAALSREELAAISSSTPSTFEGIAPLTRHHEPAGVRLRIEPAFEGFTGEGLVGGLWITEGALSFYDEAAQKGISLPYPHITLHAISRDPAPSSASASTSTSNGTSSSTTNGAPTTLAEGGGACIYCQIEESEEVLEDTDGMEESGTREMWISPSAPESVDKIFSMLSYCASLHPAASDPSASFMQGADSSTMSTTSDENQNPQPSLFAAMGLDPSSMVFANPDGSLGGPGLEAMRAEQYEDGEEEEGQGEGAAEEDSSAGRQRSDYVNEGRARGAPY
ncbi:hypothetical protein JCM10908_006622 [Rhodotorula pacifica]|uniref:Voldacs domain-containing protein n=1 Tax=Rhodotorula pacifica TaxID=1495444 RepID=UPI00316F5CDA